MDTNHEARAIWKSRYETNVFEFKTKYYIVVQQTLSKIGFRTRSKAAKSEMNFCIYEIAGKSQEAKPVHEGTFFDDDTFEEQDEENSVIAHKNAFVQVDDCIVYMSVERTQDRGGPTTFVINRFNLDTKKLEEGRRL